MGFCLTAEEDFITWLAAAASAVQLAITLSKRCVQCLDKRKKRHIIHKNSLNQLEDGSSEYQDIQTDTSSAIDIQTDSIENNKGEVHIDELSQLVNGLVLGNNLFKFELDVIFDNEEGENSISQIAERIWDEFTEGDRYKWK